MKIFEVMEKKLYLPLLLLADEQENMIEKYLGGGVLEIKNIAVEPAYQNRGYGKALINFLVERYSGAYKILQVGTGDSPLTIPFYEKCGFKRHHVVKNFFVDNYDRAIFEGGVRLVDMIFLRRKL